jgi:type II secretory pathway component PulF
MIKYYWILAKDIQKGWQLFFKTGIHPKELRKTFLFMIYLFIPIPQVFLKRANHLLFSQLHDFHHMGFSVLKSLEIIYRSPHPCFPAQVIQNICKSLESGLSLKQSFGLYAEYFSPMTLAFLEMAHHSGHFFDFMHLWFENEKRLQAHTHQIRQQLSYPFILILVLVVLLHSFFSHTFYQYQAFANLLHIPRPKSLALLESLKPYLFFTPLLPFTILIYRKKIIAKLGIKKNFDWWLWSSSMHICLKSGVSWPEALLLIEKHFPQLHQKSWLRLIQLKLRQGHPFEECFTETPLVIQQYLPLLKSSAAPELIFSHLADYFLREFEKSLSKIERYVQPFLLLILAGFIGMSLWMMYQPLFEMGLNL